MTEWTERKKINFSLALCTSYRHIFPRVSRNNLTFISTSGKFWINQVMSARKATFSHLFGLAGTKSMHATENSTGL
jgi:hypothetical protein